MNSNDDFDIKNLERDYFYSYPAEEKPKRSIKKKLGIVFAFLAILAITPPVLFGLKNINFNKFNKSEKVSVAKEAVFENKKTVNQNTENPKPQLVNIEVLNNDSYWKISKRYCGSGKYYLSIRDQNNGKPLFKGDFVTVDCFSL